MKYYKLSFISFTLLLTMILCAQAEQVEWEVLQTEKVANPPEIVKLEYKLITGNIFTYKLTIAGEGTLILPGQREPAELRTNSKLTLTQQVKSHDQSSGIWQLHCEVTKGTMAVPDFPDVRLSFPAMDIEVDKSGMVKAVKGLDKLTGNAGMPQDGAFGEILSQLKFAGFPQKDLKLNDSWEQEYTTQVPGTGPVKVKATSTLEGFDRVGKLDCAKIHTVYEAPLTFVSEGLVESKEQGKGDSAASGEETKTPPMVGKEKGEFWTYFAYNEGKVVQRNGTIELTGVFSSGDKDDAAPKPAGDGEATKDKTSPTLSVKFHVVSQLVSTEASDSKEESR